MEAAVAVEVAAVEEGADGVAGDEVALEAVEDAAEVAGAGGTAEGVVDADADVAGDEVVDAEVAAEAVGAAVVELAEHGGEAGVELDLSGGAR